MYAIFVSISTPTTNLLSFAMSAIILTCPVFLTNNIHFQQFSIHAYGYFRNVHDHARKRHFFRSTVKMAPHPLFTKMHILIGCDVLVMISLPFFVLEEKRGEIDSYRGSVFVAGGGNHPGLRGSRLRSVWGPPRSFPSLSLSLVSDVKRST